MKWITFEQCTESKNHKTRVWRVVAKQGNQPLGLVLWYSGWRKYVFAPDTGSEYEQDCLRDIAEFIESATREHYENAKAKALDDSGANQG